METESLSGVSSMTFQPVEWVSNSIDCLVRSCLRWGSAKASIERREENGMRHSRSPSVKRPRHQTLSQRAKPSAETTVGIRVGYSRSPPEPVIILALSLFLRHILAFFSRPWIINHLDSGDGTQSNETQLVCGTAKIFDIWPYKKTRSVKRSEKIRSVSDSSKEIFVSHDFRCTCFDSYVSKLACQGPFGFIELSQSGGCTVTPYAHVSRLHTHIYICV